MNEDGIFDKRIAESYDRHHQSDPRELAQMAEVLKELTTGGRALEFAIGTGRVALPLQGLGVEVAGIELSKAMVQELRKKETGPPMTVAIGDMTTTQTPGPFSLVYLVYNTIDNLTSQEAQLACFQNAAGHLEVGGRFLVETLVPPLQKIPFGQTKLAFSRSENHWGIDEFDVTTQNYRSHHVRFEEGTHRKLSVPFRYAWPAEMDLMAKMAGMTLEQRWSDWMKSPFGNESNRHISIWRK